MPPVDPLLIPFWLTSAMYRESVVLAGGEDSAAGPLLFAPVTIVEVTSAAGDRRYVEGVDYHIDRAGRRLVRHAGSAMPFVSSGADAAAEGGLTHPWTVEVTYTHAGDPFLWRPSSSGNAQLPRVTRKLQQRRAVTLAVTGDSISEGYDASGYHRLAPFQPPFAPLVASALEQHYGGAVRLHNVATAGWTAADGFWDTGRIDEAAPDLVIVAYGMNDACYAEADEYGANISELLRRLREQQPDVEFVLVSPMLATPACAWVVHDRFDAYRLRLREIAEAGDGVAFVDVTRLWTELLAHKTPYDLSGNWLNHPNDFGHRLYAQMLIAALCGGDPALSL